MALMGITYDLGEPIRDYAKLIVNIKELGDWTRTLDSFWRVDTPYSVVQIQTALKRHVGVKDRIFVSAISGWTAYN